MASPHKIDNRRGHCKCFSDAELERRTQTDGPVALRHRPVDRLRVIEPQDHQAQHVDPNRAAPAAQRRPNQQGVVAGRPSELHGRPLAPRHAGVVEQRRLDGREADWEEPEHETAGQWEAQLDVGDGDLRADQLVELVAPGEGAAGARVGDAFVVADRPVRVAAQQFGRAEENWKALRVASEAAVHQSADGDGEGAHENVTPVVGESGGELPGAESGRDLETRARPGERTDVPEQRVVVHQRERWLHVADRAAGQRVVGRDDGPAVI